jgi:hypothetical protein
MIDYVEAVSNHFLLSPCDLASDYVWPKNNPKCYVDTFNERQAMSQEFLSDPRSRNRLAIQMVRRWGGINGGSDDSITDMAHQSPNQLIARGFVRVASWSKVATLHDPHKFFIYDARVAFSINAIIFDAGYTDKFFPMPDSRNTKIKGAKSALAKNGIRFGRSTNIAGQNFYKSYIELIHEVGNQIKKPAWQVEMALFALGPALAQKLSAKLENEY